MNIEQVEIQSGKGTVAATVSETSSPMGLAVFLPGFCDSRRYPHGQGFVRDLANAGWTSVAFDATGMWDSIKSDDDIKKYSVTQILEDAHNVRYEMEKRNGGNFPRVAICGHSLGGMVALIYSGREKVYAAAAIMAPQRFFQFEKQKVAEWKNVGEKVSRRVNPTPGGNDVVFHLPFTMFEDAALYDAAEEIKKAYVPRILIAGSEDIGVRPLQVERLYREMQYPKQYKLLEGVDHNYRENEAHVRLVNTEVINFLAAYLDIEI